jgi:hypothetical protein
MTAAGQPLMALRYCEQGIVLMDRSIIYKGDPEICLEIVKDRRRSIRESLQSPDSTDDPSLDDELAQII